MLLAKCLYTSTSLLDVLKEVFYMAELELTKFILAIIVGTLAAIFYSLRILILLERRVASMEENIQKMWKEKYLLSVQQ